MRPEARGLRREMRGKTVNGSLAKNNERKRSMSEHGFKKLAVWQRAKRLAVSVYKVTAEGKVTRDFGLVEQMRRSAVSVPSNIAEGDERDSDKDSARFFQIAKGSLGELANQVEIAVEVGYLEPGPAGAISQECLELGKMLGSLIKARRRLVPKVLPIVAGLGLGILLSRIA